MHRGASRPLQIGAGPNRSLLTVSVVEEARHLTKAIGVSDGDAGVQLTYNSGSARPQIVMNRLKLMGKIEKVKEKNCLSDPGQCVLII